MVLSSENALKILQKDYIKNTSIINLIENNNYSKIEQYGNSILLRKKNQKKTIYIYSNNEQELRKLLQSVRSDDTHYAAIENWMVPIITANRNIEKIVNTYKVILPSHISLLPPTIPVRLLNEKDAEIINNHWEFRSEESIYYVRKRILEGISAGIDKHLKLVAWCLTHDDGAIGFLYVLESYRKKGYAKNVTISIINTLKRMGKIPFAFIVEDNYKSYNLFEKLGFVKDRKLSWITLQ